MSARVDFTSQAFFRDERLRGIGPVVRTKFPIIGTVWITTTYELTARVLKDSETFTLRKERHVRSSSAIQALAETPVGRALLSNPVAAATWPEAIENLAVVAGPVASTGAVPQQTWAQNDDPSGSP
jgi:hypothetical protein